MFHPTIAEFGISDQSLLQKITKSVYHRQNHNQNTKKGEEKLIASSV